MKREPMCVALPLRASRSVRRRSILGVAAALSWLGCTDPDPNARPDAAALDAGRDAGSSGSDAGRDGGVEADGGIVSSACPAGATVIRYSLSPIDPLPSAAMIQLPNLIPSAEIVSDSEPPPVGDSATSASAAEAGAAGAGSESESVVARKSPSPPTRKADTAITATVALFDGTRFGVGHIGDSRAYLYRRGELRQLTHDHTFVQSLIDEGRITEEQSRTHPHRNLILKALDGIRHEEPDLFEFPAEPGDRVFLCSDGACGTLTHDRMAEILGTGTPDFAAVELVRASL